MSIKFNYNEVKDRRMEMNFQTSRYYKIRIAFSQTWRYYKII
jgi:hypothetical protein